MRNSFVVLVCALGVSLCSLDSAFADGFVENKAWAVRTPSGPIDKGLTSHTPAQKDVPSTTGSSGGSRAASNQAAPVMVAGTTPPAAPAVTEEATPTPPVQAQSLGNAGGQASAAKVVEAKGPPIWSNRWFWALAALALLAGAGFVEWRGRKRDEELAAEEPDDAPLKA